MNVDVTLALSVSFSHTDCSSVTPVIVDHKHGFLGVCKARLVEIRIKQNLRVDMHSLVRDLVDEG